MRASTSRTVYCIGLFMLTACAVLPAPAPTVTSAITTSAPLAVEERLAQSIRQRIELEVTLPADNGSLANVAATEAALRSLAFADDPAASRKDLIAALADELSGALAERGRLSADGADKKRQAQVETVITRLIAAINSEVNRNRA